MNVDDGRIRRWSDLTEAEKASGRWVRLTEEEHARAYTMEEAERVRALQAIFHPEGEPRPRRRGQRRARG